MIGKQIKGAGFRGVLNYMEAKVNEGSGQFLDTNMMSDNARNLAKEFGIIRGQIPGIKKAVYHCSLAICKEEKLTNEQFKKLGQEYLQKMGFGNSQYVMYRHYDREHPHIHLIANRIDMHGKVVSDKWDYRRSEKAIRELEKKYGLSTVLNSTQSKEASLSKGQVELYRRTGTIPAKKQIQMILRDVLNKASTISEFEKSLTEKGVATQYHKNNKENVFGVSFELEGQTFKGSALGKGYSWSNINNQINLNYERNRRSGEEINRGASPNIRWSGRTAAEDKYKQHSGTERGDNTIDWEFGKANNGFAPRNDQHPGATNQSDYGNPDNGTTKGFPGEENIKSEKNEITNGFQNPVDSSSDWNDGWNLNLLNPVLSSSSVNNEDEDLPPKKRKKKKGKNTGMSM